jgi:hypothetical protein
MTPVTVRLEDAEVVLGDCRVVGLLPDHSVGDAVESPSDPDFER